MNAGGLLSRIERKVAGGGSKTNQYDPKPLREKLSPFAAEALKKRRDKSTAKPIRRPERRFPKKAKK